MQDMVAELHRHRGRPAEELRADRTAWLAVERALQRAIQNLLDISMHLLTEADAGDWDDYRGVILHLGENGIVPVDFADRISGMAGTRNLLVHGYTEVAVDRILSTLREHLEDFATFAAHVIDYLEAQRGTHP